MELEAWVTRDTDGTIGVFTGDHPVDDGEGSEGVVWIAAQVGEYLEACNGMDDQFPEVGPGECRKAKLIVGLID